MKEFLPIQGLISLLELERLSTLSTTSLQAALLYLSADIVAGNGYIIDDLKIANCLEHVIYLYCTYLWTKKISTDCLKVMQQYLP